GRSGFDPAGAWLRDVLVRFPTPASLRLLADLHVAWVMIHDTVERPLCQLPVLRASPHLALAFAEGNECVFQVLSAPPPPRPPPPPDRPPPLAGARIPAGGGPHVETVAGTDVAAVTDGDRRTHWLQTIVPIEPGWLEIELPEPRRLTRVVMRLGPHFGDYLR